MAEQAYLFDPDAPPAESPHAESPAGLNARSSLRAATSAFEVHMQQEGFTENTVKAFRSDLNILAKFIGTWTAIGDISTADLKRFTHWLVHERDAPCNPKSLARRVTALKVFFGWLAETEVLVYDPALALIHKPTTTPLPDVLSDAQVEQVLEVTEALRHAKKPDSRPHLLVTLLLHTGIKKGECMNIVMNHLDFSDPTQPVLWIRYANPKRRHKERKLRLPEWWPEVLTEYRAQYQPEKTIFPCTARNLEYVLANVAERANLGQKLSFESLRWTCAVRGYKAGMEPDKLRQKMGLSKITWREARTKIARLASPAL
jgi:site-specific recombinase XerD